jgi:hypothetical protein
MRTILAKVAMKSSHVFSLCTIGAIALQSIITQTDKSGNQIRPILPVSCYISYFVILLVLHRPTKFMQRQGIFQANLYSDGSYAASRRRKNLAAAILVPAVLAAVIAT